MAMNDQEINDICTERLGRWQKRLVDEHATPVLLVGVGHDHKNGQIVVCTTEDMLNDDLLLFMRYAVQYLESLA